MLNENENILENKTKNYYTVQKNQRYFKIDIKLYNKRSIEKKYNN